MVLWSAAKFRFMPYGLSPKGFTGGPFKSAACFVQRGPHMHNQAFVDMGLHYDMSDARGDRLCRDAFVNGDENDRRGNLSIAQMSDQFQSVHAGHSIIDDEAIARAR